MSGSSLDGLDMALCDFRDEHHFTMLKSTCIPFSAEWIDRLEHFDSLDLHGMCQLEADFTKYLASQVIEFIGEDAINYIASHGHTLVHSPTDGYSYQLGQGAYIAAHTGIPVISEFRLQDIAKGGQGAPIAPVVETFLFPDYDAYLNLGGICNISIHDAGAVTAYDIGPCNQLLNALALLLGQDYDKGGQLASQGVVLQQLLHKSLAHPFYAQPHPKSLDNSYVMKEFVTPILLSEDSVEDRLRTSTALISKIINDAIPDGVSSVLATGGGAHNTFLIESLRAATSSRGISIIIPDKEVIDYKEAILMALMGYLRVNNIPNVYCSVTGASSDTISGAIYL